jgi:hypothetical protein
VERVDDSAATAAPISRLAATTSPTGRGPSAAAAAPAAINGAKKPDLVTGADSFLSAINWMKRRALDAASRAVAPYMVFGRANAFGADILQKYPFRSSYPTDENCTSI